MVLSANPRFCTFYKSAGLTPIAAFQGQTLTVLFSEENGKLFGAPVGETPEEIKPVEGKPLCFDITVASSGRYNEM